MTYRLATQEDCPCLARLNHQLVQDEGHRNRMTVPELEVRMRDWLSGDYRAVIFEAAAEVMAYALFREQSTEVHLRHLFVVRHRRGQGIGRWAVQTLRWHFWPSTKRLTVDVLVTNKNAIAFWRAVGYSDYALTLEIQPDAAAGP
ncbi:MAG: GNAT family N-acetyltransferase [Verrucomicrobiae bacterium]|nr:GNAT family N-acetyltransferase [Verrucomicrobiae bacterium]MCP5524253.1 GNAT family N-acetyltransferase [Verrucomicrobiales bacterium]